MRRVKQAFAQRIHYQQAIKWRFPMAGRLWRKTVKNAESGNDFDFIQG